MTDAFICDVIKNNMDGTWDVKPRIIEFDGTNHKVIKVNAVTGLYPSTGDVVMVVTARNNLDDKKISRFYESSETNGRIVGIAEAQVQYAFKGDYKFDGDVIITGAFTTNGDLTVEGNLIVAKNATVTEDLVVLGDISTLGKMTALEAVVGSLTVGGSPYLGHTHLNNASSYPATVPTGPVI